jgi:hypothetical protein
MDLQIACERGGLAVPLKIFTMIVLVKQKTHRRRWRKADVL